MPGMRGEHKKTLLLGLEDSVYFDGSRVTYHIENARNRRILSNEYHDFEVMQLDTPDGQRVNILLAEVGAVKYILVKRADGLYDEAEGPFHSLEYDRTTGMLQTVYGEAERVAVVDPTTVALEIKSPAGRLHAR